MSAKGCSRAREIEQEAKGNEHEELLSSAFVTADVGKVHLLLREALGRTPAV